MRVFALLFALYFAVLGCLSCTEVEAYAEPTQTTTVQPATHNSPAPVADWCSPLCQCHCCPGFALPQAPAVAFVAQLSPPKDVLRFNSWPAPAVPARALATPWQPPQGA